MVICYRPRGVLVFSAAVSTEAPGTAKWPISTVGFAQGRTTQWLGLQTLERLTPVLTCSHSTKPPRRPGFGLFLHPLRASIVAEFHRRFLLRLG